MRLAIFTILGALGAMTATPALAGGVWSESVTKLDLLWILISACLVVVMQAGFMLVEAGGVRSKNSISVAVRNVVDLAVAVLLFALVGFTVMYGVGAWGLFGVSPGAASLDQGAPALFAFFLFNAAFCATAATIFSGAVAERMALTAYAPTMVFIAAVVYPVFGHWVWGATLNPDNAPLLASIGFYDFAGATVVHSIGAWVALAGAIAVGPRLGRYDEDGRAIMVHGHSKVLAALGLLFLIVGWLGFNGGSALALSDDVPKILTNTLIAAAAGGAAMMVTNFVQYGQLHPDRLIWCMVAGMVSVTAAPNLVSLEAAAFLGATGGWVNMVAGRALARAKVDDVVGVVASHGVAGAWGTIAVAFLAPAEALPLGAAWPQFLAQLSGVGAAFAWAFSLSWIWFKALGAVIPLRAPAEQERQGLNASEHGALLGADRLCASVRGLCDGEADLSLRVSVEPGDENYDLAQNFNRLLSQLEAKEIARRHQDEMVRQREERAQREEADRAERERLSFEGERATVKDISDFIARAADGELGERIDVDGKSAVLSEVSYGVNRLIDGLSGSIGAIARSADDINDACSSLAEVSDDLRHRSAEQIDSVQSVTFRLSTMADAANLNSELAEAALGVAQETREVSDVVYDGVSRIEEAMLQIESSAGAIAPVVEMIESIAFKTNLLAVNAAIEAARAGEAGRSFAVVSNEVRALAINTQQFADDIGDMVKASLAAVRRGASVVEETSGRVKTVHTTADRVSEQINKIHASSIDQRDKLNSLYDAVMSIAEVSSGNAKLAGETASASAKLANQGRNLVDGVKNFRGYESVEKEAVDATAEDEGDADLSIQLF